jgi:hypothetical protein
MTRFAYAAALAWLAIASCLYGWQFVHRIAGG